MPITQATVLLIYGQLVEVVDLIEATNMRIREPGFFDPDNWDQRTVRAMLAKLETEARALQRAAVEQLMQDAPGVTVNPITGRAS